ncbi:MAG: phage holin family protein [Candidatus Omnitrophota bacterium]
MLFLLKFALSVTSLVLVARICPGISIIDWQAALAAAAMLAILNMFLKPVLVFLTLPINMLSFGMFTFFINGLLFYAVSRVVPGFLVNSYGSALLGAFLYSVINLFLNIFLNRGRMDNRRPRGGAKPKKDVIDVEAEIET